jgi:hypothetical protein
MTEIYSREQFEADRKVRDERAAREQKERWEHGEKEAAKQGWIADGGDEGDFETLWPEIRDEARRERVMSAEQQAREVQRQRSRI